MKSIRLAIVDPSDTHKTFVELPYDFRIGDIIPALVTAMNLPSYHPNGRQLEYRLQRQDAQQSSIYLDMEDTFGSAGIAADETLYLKSEFSRPLRVFLCHSSHDKPQVRSLYGRLTIVGIDPWLDEEKLLPGQDWNQEITKAVRYSDVVIVCLSRGSINKAGYVQKEIKIALDVADEQPDDTIFVIPLKLEDCEVPERLRRWQWVNYFEEKGERRLMLALESRARQLGAVVPKVE